MKTTVLVMTLALLAAVLPRAGRASAAESATPDEVIAKVHEAAAFLAENGEAGLAEFNDPNGGWVFKDTYVFVFNCVEGYNAGQPLVRMNVGKKIADITDAHGAPVGRMICDAGKYPAGRWIEYYFPEPTAGVVMRKLAFVYPVAGTPYVVGAGIYGSDEKVEDLNRRLGQE
jgi:cytochrome c